MAVPAIKNDEVLIKVKQVGNYTPSRPFVLGHEFSGDIVDVGSEVKNLKQKGRDQILNNTF